MLNSYMQDTSCTIKKKFLCFKDFHLDMISIISDLLKYNEIFAQNMQIFRANVFLKLETASNYVNFVLETICRARLEEYNHILKSLNEIRELVNCIVRNKKETMENYEQFGKVD